MRLESTIHLRRKRSGASLALIAVMLPIVILLCAFAINVSQMQLTRTELQISTDASARAAGRIYAETNDLERALSVANLLGERNLVSGDEMLFDMDDVDLGISTRASISQPYSFSESASDHNSLRLSGRRTAGSPSGPVSFLFPMFTKTKFETSTNAVSTQVELDIALVIDRSGSMAYADNEPAVYPPVPATAPAEWFFGDAVPPNARWFAAVSATEAFFTELINSPQDENVALVTYADSSTEDVSLTSDYLSILGTLNDYTAALPGGGTNIAAGIASGSNALASGDGREFATKVIIMMTDGRITVHGSSPTYLASLAAQQGAMVFTVTFSDEADISLMQAVADAGSGKHFHATTGADLILVFEEIAKSLPTLITQ